MTVQHLQETGVGRTVNGLRKYDGAVGNAAKALVAKWKAMVVDEYSSGEEEDEACATAENCADNHNSLKPEGLAENNLNQIEELKHVQEESKNETSVEQSTKHLSRPKEQSPKDSEDKNKRHEKSSHSSKHSHNEMKFKESRSSKSSSRKDETHKKEHNHSKNDDLEKANDKLTKNNESTSGRKTFDSDSLKRENKKSKLSDNKNNDETPQLFISSEKNSSLKSSEIKVKVENDKDKSSVKQEKEKKSSQEESRSSSSKLKSQDSSSKTKESSEKHKHKKEHTDHKKVDTKKDSNHSSKEIPELKISSDNKDHVKNKDRDKKKRERKEDKSGHGKKKEMKMRLSQGITSNEGIDCNSG